MLIAICLASAPKLLMSNGPSSVALPARSMTSATLLLPMSGTSPNQHSNLKLQIGHSSGFPLKLLTLPSVLKSRNDDATAMAPRLHA